MKALSIKQPWAWLICAGYKDIENRDWPTSFTGRIYVHTGKLMDRDAFAWISKNIPMSIIQQFMVDGLPNPNMFITGAIIGEVDITGILRRIKYEFEYVTSMGDKQRELEWLEKNKPAYFSPWFTSECGLTLANPVLYDKPIPCKGKLGFFEPEIGGIDGYKRKDSLQTITSYIWRL